MFIFDVETMGSESTAVILSAAITYFSPKDTPSYQELLDNTLFVKFNATDQIKRLKRTVDKSTMDWWSKQTPYAQSISMKPKMLDLLVEDGVDQLIQYMNRYETPRDQIMWARGSLDQVCIDSLSKCIDKPTLSEYYNWRDIRTYVDVVYGSTNGYCDISHPEFNRDLVIKHHPAHDCCLDAMMILYGKEKS